MLPPSGSTPITKSLAWPDPIEWYGRDVEEQAHDLTALLDARAADLRAAGRDDEADELEALSEPLWLAAQD